MFANSLFQSLRHALLGLALVASAAAQDAGLSAKDLAARMSEGIQDGSSAVRLKMDFARPDGTKTVLQIKASARRTAAATDVIYQILWPKERKGESFLLKKSGARPATGAVFTPPGTLTSLNASDMKNGVFGSDLAYDDLVDNFYAWGEQKIIGTETVDKIECQILESKGGNGSYRKVISWIDPKRMVPMRVDKYGESGKLVRSIYTTRVSKDDTGRTVPSSFRVVRAGDDSQTEIEGSNSRHDVTFTDSDFTPEALRTLK
jgi:outer membrane lipoprotein-sorting protein